jgi:uncharacterized protein
MDVLLAETTLLAPHVMEYVWLVLIGFATGLLTGMFGIGGAFITTPVMIALLGIDSSIAVGCSMGLTLATGVFGLFKHSRVGKIEIRALWLIGISSCFGTLIGFQFHYMLKASTGPKFPDYVNLFYVVILIPIGILVWWQSNKKIGKPLLSKFHIPPMMHLRQKDLPAISMTLLGLMGLSIGLAKGLIGIGGGIVLVPILVLAVGMTPQRAAGVSLGMTLLSSIVGLALYAVRGDFNLAYVVALFAGSYLGVIIGTQWCHAFSPTRAKRLLAITVLSFAGLLAWQVLAG